MASEPFRLVVLCREGRGCGSRHPTGGPDPPDPTGCRVIYVQPGERPGLDRRHYRQYPTQQGPLRLGATVERTAKFLGRTFSYGYRVTAHEPDRLVEMRV